MSQGARTRVYLVKGFKHLALREKLMLQAQRHFPTPAGATQEERTRIESLRTQWVEARIALGDKVPAGRIGDGPQSSTTFPRTRREAGIHTEEHRVPRLFRRFFKARA